MEKNQQGKEQKRSQKSHYGNGAAKRHNNELRNGTNFAALSPYAPMKPLALAPCHSDRREESRRSEFEPGSRRGRRQGEGKAFGPRKAERDEKRESLYLSLCHASFNPGRFTAN